MRRIVELASGELRITPPQEVMRGFQFPATDKDLFYSTEYGEELLISAYISYLEKKYSGVDLKQENILVTPGAKFGIWFLFNYLLREGDTVLLPTPAWPSYRLLAERVRVRLVYYNVMSESLLEDLFTQLARYTPRVTVLNFPHNPTGKELSGQAVKTLLAHADRPDTYVLYDESLRAFALLDNTDTSLRFIKTYENLIAIDSVSKWFGMAGLRTGFICANGTLIEKLARHHDFIGGSVPTLVQSAVGRLLADKRSLLWLDELNTYCRRNVKKLGSKFIENGFKIDGEGGLYLWASEGNRRNVERIVLNDTDIVVMPGRIFGKEGYFRACPARNPEELNVLYK
jgi:aspartate/methionine/tyrosine aminotransferase